MEIPYFKKITNDCKVTHGRNSHIKDEIYFDLFRGNSTKTICIRMDNQDLYKRVLPMAITVQNNLSKHDSWLTATKIKGTLTGMMDICQTISVDQDD
jgi:hypothetical protein